MSRGPSNRLTPEIELALAVNRYLAVGETERLAELVALHAPAPSPAPAPEQAEPPEPGPKLSGPAPEPGGATGRPAALALRYEALRGLAAAALAAAPIEREAARARLAAALTEALEAILRQAELRRLIPEWAKRPAAGDAASRDDAA